jgi:hypothetical protein
MLKKLKKLLRKQKNATKIKNFLIAGAINFEIKMKLAQTTLSKLRRSDLFVENRSAQDSQLRRSGIFGGASVLASRCLRTATDFVFGSWGHSPHQPHQIDVAPTELKKSFNCIGYKDFAPTALGIGAGEKLN